MSHMTYVEYHRYLPQGVKQIIVHGGGCWVGKVDEMTFLNYLHTDEEMKWVQIEAKILSALGRHPRIIQSEGEGKMVFSWGLPQMVICTTTSPLTQRHLSSDAYLGVFKPLKP
ncbi:hypothetical protein IQ07DRAFT_677616 [Pyrenochaeta sp. DS3sAY3a]|nr:hypothetical protein IQ07DRAFT_677616 [Pyrenochaeta sp. DS3sAY3a]